MVGKCGSKAGSSPLPAKASMPGGFTSFWGWVVIMGSGIGGGVSWGKGWRADWRDGGGGGVLVLVVE